MIFRKKLIFFSLFVLVCGLGATFFWPKAINLTCFGNKDLPNFPKQVLMSLFRLERQF